MSKFAIKSSLLTLALAMGFMGCGEDNTAGTVTDTGNTVAAVTGVVHRADGTVASAATVRMARMAVVNNGSMQIPERVEVETDSAGVFAFDSALADTFQLAVIDSKASEIFYLPRTTRESNDHDTIQLEKAMVLKSVLYYQDVVDPAVPVGSHFTVGLSGTPFFESVFAADSFDMLIPAGDWWLGFFPGDPEIVAKLQESGVPDSLIYRSWYVESDKLSGDSAFAGPFVWSTTAEVDSLIKESEAEAKNVARISGKLLCKEKSSCAGVEVMPITDLYGFGFVDDDSLEFKSQTMTDSTGRWWLPVPAELPNDTFRVEFRKVKDGKVVLTGDSRYVLAKEVEDLKDTLDIGSDSLSKPSTLVSGVSLVVDREDTTQSNNCMVNSVVVGIKGTSHFVRDVTCNLLTLSDLPKGEQEIVMYSGDPKVMSKMRASDVPESEYITLIEVVLPENGIQQQQWMTYTPPSLK